MPGTLEIVFNKNRQPPSHPKSTVRTVFED